MKFSYGIRPHGNAAAARRYFDRLAALELAGRKPTPAEARTIVAERRRYVRTSVRYARRKRWHKPNYSDTINADAVQFPASRSRERRAEPARAAIGRDDDDDEPRARGEQLPRLMCSLCGRRADSVHILPGAWDPKVIRFACPRHDPGGYWFPIRDWHDGPPDFHRPGERYTMRRHLLVTKTHGHEAVALIERAMRAHTERAA